MRQTFIYKPGDIRVENVPDPGIVSPTDAIIRIVATCVCGSDLWDYRGINPAGEPHPIGHEYAGVVEEIGGEVSAVKPGQFVIGTGWYAAIAAEVKPGSTVAVVGDGAVGLCAVIAARELGAERIIAMSRHASRQKLATEFGATDLVAERGEEGVARIKELTGGIGADSVLECVGLPESMQQALRSTRPGGNVGFVGVPHGVQIDGEELFYSHAGLRGGH